jgi:glycosyltransferase involved in cell wall biosynthesis
MKIHAMTLIKNESDIVAQSLTAAAGWCDHIYVFDNGSVDGTWEIVNELAGKHPQIIPFKQEDKPFADALRAEIFNAYRHLSKDGDWWLTLDADELYVGDPREFLEHIPSRYNVAWSATLTYVFTDRDAERYRAGEASYGDDIPVREKCRYYLNDWAEARFFRYSERLTWEQADGGRPRRTLRTWDYRHRIPVQHFPYRSPQQIEKRASTCRPAIERGAFRHEAIADWGSVISRLRADKVRGLDLSQAGPQYAARGWEDRIVAASSVDFDGHDGRFTFNEYLMPRIPPRRSVARAAAGRIKARMRAGV